MLAKIVVAVEELHKKGVCHRDLKVDNFVIRADGHVSLIDFGLSKLQPAGHKDYAKDWKHFGEMIERDPMFSSAKCLVSHLTPNTNISGK